MLQTLANADREYFLRYKKVLRDELVQAEQMINQDEASSLMDVPGFLDCANGKVTAGAFADYYGSSPKFFTPSLLPAIKMPTLVVGGDADPQAPELAAAMRNLADHKLVVFQEVQGADHYFRDAAADELADKIKEFLAHRLEATAVAAPPPAAPQPAGVKMKPRK